MKYKKSFYKFFACIVATGMFLDCTNPVDPEAIQVQPTPPLLTNTGQRVRLARIRTINAKSQTPQWIDYKYDSLNRLISVVDETNFIKDTYQYNKWGQVIMINHARSPLRTMIYAPTSQYASSYGALLYTTYSERANFTYDANGNVAQIKYASDTTGHGSYMELRRYDFTYDAQNVPLKGIMTASNATVVRTYTLGEGNIINVDQVADNKVLLGPLSGPGNAKESYSFGSRQSLYCHFFIYDFNDVNFFSKSASPKQPTDIIDDRGLLVESQIYNLIRINYYYDTY